MILKMGKKKGRNKVNEKEFNDMELVVMKLIKDKIGEEMKYEEEEDWKKELENI
jgi:hypothetical protein